MTMVIVYGKEIELKDKLEKGELELDLFNEDINLEDTQELMIISDSVYDEERENNE